MKKTVFTLILALSAFVGVNAQSSIYSKTDKLVFDDLTSDPTSKIPQSYDKVTAEGDLNKDGIKDFIVIAYPTDETNIEDPSEEGFPIDNNQPTMAIYFGTDNNQYKKFKEYPKSIAPKGYGLSCNLSITEKGLIRFEFLQFKYKAADEYGTNVYLFRYQNNDFFMIGKTEYKYWDPWTWSQESSTVSYNFLTGKMSTSTTDEETGKKETKWDTCSKDLIELSKYVLNLGN
ncbi:MAG: hypothetical protein MJ211_07245 [Bacteroidales bacterium]|nr:hypothetical protein [Bacteroidales bacterium]